MHTDDAELRDLAWKSAYQTMQSHTIPSPETARRLEALERKIEEDREYHLRMIALITQFERLPQMIDTLSSSVSSLEKSVLVSETNNKTVRTIVYSAVGLILTAFVTGVISLVIIK